MTYKKHILLFSALFSFNIIFCMSKVKTIISGIGTLVHHAIATYSSLNISHQKISAHKGTHKGINAYVDYLPEADETTKDFIYTALQGNAAIKNIKICPLNPRIPYAGIMVTNKTLVLPEYLDSVSTIGAPLIYNAYLYKQNIQYIHDTNQLSIPDMIKKQKQLINEENLSTPDQVKLSYINKKLDQLTEVVKHENKHVQNKDSLKQGIVFAATPLLGQLITHCYLPNYKQRITKNIRTKLRYGAAHALLYSMINNAYTRHIEYQADKGVENIAPFKEYLTKIDSLQFSFGKNTLHDFFKDIIPSKNYNPKYIDFLHKCDYLEKNINSTHPSTKNRIANLRLAKDATPDNKAINNPFA